MHQSFWASLCGQTAIQLVKYGVKQDIDTISEKLLKFVLELIPNPSRK